ncbi:IclR family transcriptional regulator [Congregibacter brevis]|uniref:IclR family transcriptional regulator n=1 Tax=Congregibacter brevis TaxID=3081201 RepID=A0ABZ0IGS1_9GAMM|nr:IclR family transcriptional regulator [Congregibacter sp. IMCC45268]
MWYSCVFSFDIENVVAPKKIAAPRKGIQVIARAASVLRTLENESDGLSLGQIAKATDLSRSTVQRIVDALAEEHFVIGATPTSRVKLGPAILRMASNSSFNFVEFIRPYIAKLAKDTGETVDVSEMQKKRTVFVDQVVGSGRLNIVSPVGEAFPLHCLASGKAMLATLSDADVRKRLGPKELERHTTATKADLNALLKELAAVRKLGVAFDYEEHLEGVSAVGTAIQEPGGTLYAISIPVPTVRFKRSKLDLQKALLQCRADIVEEIEN